MNSDVTMRIWWLLAAVALMALGCGKPGVKLAAVSGEVRQIPVWRVAWAGSADTLHQALSGSPLTKTKSRYDNPEYARLFVQRVTSELQWQHHLPVMEQSTTGGLISIDLEGQKILSNVQQSDLMEDRARILDETIDVEGLKSPDEDPLPSSDMAQWPEDYVGFVEVTIYGVDQRELARILIGQNDDRKIKPEFVANVIARALSKGSY